MHRYRLIFTALLACAGTATAQSSSPQSTSPVYDSAFASYQKYQEPKVADWKATNAAIAATPGHGGHGAHAVDEHAGHVMPAAQGTKPAPATLKPAPKPTPAPTAAAVAKPDPHAEHNH